MILFYFVNQFFQLFHADFIFLDKRGDGREIGVVEIVLDDARYRAAPILLFLDDRKVLVGVAILLMVEVAFAFQNAYDG